MKLPLSSLLILSVFAVAISSSYADTVGLTTDKYAYTSDDEFVIVSGQLSDFKLYL